MSYICKKYAQVKAYFLEKVTFIWYICCLLVLRVMHYEVCHIMGWLTFADLKSSDT